MYLFPKKIEMIFLNSKQMIGYAHYEQEQSQ